MYQKNFNASLTIYKQKLSEYEQLTDTPEYQEIISTMPFQFLNATQLCRKLQLFESLEKKPHMFFSTVDEAKVFYKNLISFKSQSAKLLEDAAYMAQVGDVAEQINHLAKNDPYLGPAYQVLPNMEIINLAKQCLTEIPQYPRMLTKAFRYNYIESCILSLNTSELEWLCKANIIKSEDIDHISLTESYNDYAEKIGFLCRHFNRDAPIRQTFQVKLKGVTFANEDGSSRQDYLRELKSILDINPEADIKLRAESYTYVPETGSPEPAIRILWEDKCIGNIPKDMAADLLEKFNNPQYTADFVCLTGYQSDSYSIGCQIHLNVIASEYLQECSEKTTEER